MTLRTTVFAVLTCALIAPAALAQDRTLKMYDLRDLAPLLGDTMTTFTAFAARPSTDPLTAQPSTPVPSNIPVIGILGEDMSQPAGAPPAPPTAGGGGYGGSTPVIGIDPFFNAVAASPDSPTDVLVLKLCNLLTMSSDELVEGVYFIEGEEASHRRLHEALGSVRSLYQERVHVELICYQVDAATAPAIGDVAVAPRPGDPVVRIRTSAIRNVLTPVAATRTVSYVARWTPIVADSSVGLEPTAATVTDGLAVNLRVDSAQRPRISLHGSVTKADIVESTVPAGKALNSKGAAAPAPDAPLTIGLPHIERRTISADVSIDLGRATVIATVPAFDEDRQIVIAISLKPAE